MTAINKRQFLYTLFVLVAVFCFAPIAKASSVLDNPNGGVSGKTTSGYGGNIWWGYNGGTAVPVGTAISTATIYTGCYNNSGYATLDWEAQWNTASSTGIQVITIPCTGTPDAQLLTFPSPAFINTGVFDLSWSITGGGGTVDLGTNMQFGLTAEDGYDPFYGSYGTLVQYPKVLFGQTNSPYNIDFNTGFSNNMYTPDFTVWQVLLTFPDGMYNPGWEVEYRNASSTSWQYFDNEFLNGYGNGAFNSVVHSFKKHTALSLGNYIAEAVLFSNREPIAISDPLNFTITPGVGIITPGVSVVPTSTVYSFNATSTPNGLYNDSGCVDTSFSVLGADFGKGICTVVAFLFVPGDNVINSYSNLQQTMQSHAPFSYFYDTINAFQSINVSSSTLTGLTINTGTSTPIQVSADLFSANTIDKYTDANSRGVIRTLVNYFLYIAFVGMVILEVRHLFKGGGGQK